MLSGGRGLSAAVDTAAAPLYNWVMAFSRARPGTGRAAGAKRSGGVNLFKLIYSVGGQISEYLRSNLSSADWQLIASDDAGFADAAVRERADFLLIQAAAAPLFYRRELMRLYLTGCSPHIILFSMGRDSRFSSSFKPEQASAQFTRAENELYRVLFQAILQESVSITGGMQFLRCSDIQMRASRFTREEQLKEIISGVSLEQFMEITEEYNLNIVSPAGHYLVISKAMPYNYFDDYTHNRRLYRMLDELLRDELYVLLNRYAGGEVFSISNNSICIIINDFRQPSAKKYREQINTLLSQIYQLMDDGMTALFVGRHVNSPTEFNVVYRECINAKRMRIFYGEEQLLSVKTLRQKREVPAAEELERCISTIREFSLITPFTEFESAIEELFLRLLKSSASINYYYYSCSAINVVYDAFCHRYGVTPERRAMSRCFDKYVTVEEIAEHYLRIFKNARAQAEANSGRDNLLIYRMTAYVEDNYALDLSLEGLAEFVGFSPSYTSRFFHRHTGKTFSAYLTECRIGRAKELLSQKERPVIAEIAAAVGYRNPQFFSRTFRRLVGCSPSEYTARYRPPRNEKKSP